MPEEWTIPFRSYLDFEIEIRQGEGGKYPVSVVHSPAGETDHILAFPYTKKELSYEILRLENVLLRDLGVRRLAPSDDELAVQNFGESLFTALMAGKVGVLYESSLNKAFQEELGLRIKLRIKAPDLASLPWEYLYDPGQADFLCLSNRTPIIRYIDLPFPPQPLSISLPLRILGMISDPEDLPRLNVSHEQDLVNAALEPLQKRGLLEFTWLEGRTLSDLHDAMVKGTWHIFHFIGHGGFDEQRDEGIVVMETANGKADDIQAKLLRRMLSDHFSLRLVVLNSCRGAQGGARDVFSSTASILIQGRIPAVLAMQYSITDRTATHFSRDFYRRIVQGLPVDTAVAEARKTISREERGSFEWGIPVLYSRAPNGVLFQLKSAPVTEKQYARQPDTDKVSSPATPAAKREDTAPVQLSLSLKPYQNYIQVGKELQWDVLIENNSGFELKDLMLKRKQIGLLPGVFNLAAGQSRQIQFTASYNSPGKKTESIRLIGDGIEQVVSAFIKVFREPDVHLTLEPTSSMADIDKPVQWIVSLKNNSNIPVRSIKIFRGEKLLASAFDLSPGRERDLRFQLSYRKAGHFTEEIQLSAWYELVGIPQSHTILELNQSSTVQIIEKNRQEARKYTSQIIGIDFGTARCTLAVLENGKPIVIPSSDGDRSIPSLVALGNKKGEILVGRAAMGMPVYPIKRLLGRKFNDPEVQSIISGLMYEVKEAPDGGIIINLGDKAYSPAEITAFLLTRLKQNAENYLGKDVTQAVITVPAYFNLTQRNVIRDACRIAGLDAYPINESIASALAYGLNKRKDEMVSIYHLGGGFFEIVIVDTGDGVYQVRSYNGDTSLGGVDFDGRITENLAEEFKRKFHNDLRKDRQALLRLREASEKAKIELSSLNEVEINLPYITADASGPKHLQTVLTRARLEQLVGDLIERSLNAVRQALTDADIEAKQVDTVALTGGMTRMPAVQNAVRNFFGKEPYKGVNTDDISALGAAIRAGILCGDVKDVLILDALPLTLSVETLGGVATPLIERNTTLPTRKNQVFSTIEDKQSQVEIHIVQGERPMAADNHSLGRFILDGIPPAPKGIPRIEVTFDVEANGILVVTAADKATGRSLDVTIK